MASTIIASIKEVTLNSTGETSYYFTDDQGLQRALSVEQFKGWIEAADGFEYTRYEFKQNRTRTAKIWYA